mgnify:CR=1 FL=1
MPTKWSHFILLVAVFLWASLSFGFLVVIDPGHGGNDGGAKSDDAKESAIALSVSKLLADALKNDGRFEVKMTRTRDEFVTLEDRAEFANHAKADLFISIHTNWSEDPKARGKEIYFQNQLPPDEESLYLASREIEFHAVRQSFEIASYCLVTHAMPDKVGIFLSRTSHFRKFRNPVMYSWVSGFRELRNINLKSFCFELFF